jgi:hypothetical protein
MITVTLNPVTVCDVSDLEHAPFDIEGIGSGEMKIYFESEANRQEYLGIEIHGRLNSDNLNRIFDEMADNPNTGSIN